MTNSWGEVTVLVEDISSSWVANSQYQSKNVESLTDVEEMYSSAVEMWWQINPRISSAKGEEDNKNEGQYLADCGAEGPVTTEHQ